MPQHFSICFSFVLGSHSGSSAYSYPDLKSALDLLVNSNGVEESIAFSLMQARTLGIVSVTCRFYDTFENQF